MDIIQNRLKEMEEKNPSLNEHPQNFFQKNYSKASFLIRNKTSKMWEIPTYVSIYLNMNERYYDYKEEVDNLEVDDFKKHCLKRMLEAAKDVNGMEMARCLKGVGVVGDNNLSDRILKMANELYRHSFRQNPCGFDPIYPNPVFLGWARL